MISRHLVVPLTHSSCQFECKNYFLNPPDPTLPREKDDHHFFNVTYAGVSVCTLKTFPQIVNKFKIVYASCGVWAFLSNVAFLHILCFKFLTKTLTLTL